MKKIFLLFFILPAVALAQKNFKVHQVQPKESLYSIARAYNIHPRDLAAFNNIDINTGLSIGQELKIPVAAGAKTVAQKPVVPANPKPAEQVKTVVENGSPIYYTVGKKETLFSISKKNNTTVANIKKWNNLTTDGLSEGSKLIVGWNGDDTAELAVPPKEVPQGANTTLSDIEKQKAELALKQKALEEQEQKLKEEEARRQQELAKQQLEEQKKLEALQQKKEADERKAADKKVIDEIAVKNAPAAAPATSGKFQGGFFRNQFTGSINKEQSGTAGVFKSTSGWEDGKYYCLHNDAPIGSVVKITNPANGAVVYAKVLDVIPDLKQNANVIIRLSNSAAAELGQGEANFNCSINY